MQVLITAGATWVKIDEVRILTSVFTGNTGVFLARGFCSRRHDVTLLVNPHCLKSFPQKARVRFFNYFGELENMLIKELKKNRYDAVIHCAAVSDYRLVRPARGKIPSGRERITLKLSPAPKLIKKIRTLAPDSFLIQFKLETARQGLRDKAQNSLRTNRSDIVVANAWEDLKKGYKAAILDKTGFLREVRSKQELLNTLARLSADHLRYKRL